MYRKKYAPISEWQNVFSSMKVISFKNIFPKKLLKFYLDNQHIDAFSALVAENLCGNRSNERLDVKRQIILGLKLICS